MYVCMYVCVYVCIYLQDDIFSEHKEPRPMFVYIPLVIKTTKNWQLGEAYY